MPCSICYQTLFYSKSKIFWNLVSQDLPCSIHDQILQDYSWIRRRQRYQHILFDQKKYRNPILQDLSWSIPLLLFMSNSYKIEEEKRFSKICPIIFYSSNKKMIDHTSRGLSSFLSYLLKKEYWIMISYNLPSCFIFLKS